MTQINNRLFDDFARMMTSAAGMAQGARKEVEAVIRSQAERMLQELDMVSRDEFEAVRDMAVKAREENEALAERLAKLEAKLAAPKRKTTKRAAPRKKTSKTSAPENPAG